MASSKADSEFNEALLDIYSDEEVLYHITQSPKLITTRTESIRVLSHGLVVKPVPWPWNHRDEIDAMEKSGATAEELKDFLGKKREMKGIFEGDTEEGELEMGQSSGLVKEIKSVKQIITGLIAEFEKSAKMLQ